MASGVENFEHAGLGVDDDLFAVGVFDGGVVGFDEVVQAQLWGDLIRNGLGGGGVKDGVSTCIVKAVFPTPPSPSTTSLYIVIFPDILGR